MASDDLRSELYSSFVRYGRPSRAPEKLLRALLLTGRTWDGTAEAQELTRPARDIVIVEFEALEPMEMLPLALPPDCGANVAVKVTL